MVRRRRILLAALAALAALAVLAGCPSEDQPPACTTVDTTCTPLYEPTFANVFNTTLRNGCGSTQSACHARGGLGGMSLEDPTTAYQSLLASGHVMPGDPACSEVIVRVTSPGKDYLMPPGTPLSEAERCSLIQWVQRGAPPPTTTAPGAAP
jgi:hypothetical protein